MKKTGTILFVLMLTIFSSKTFASNQYPDTIIIQADENLKIEWSSFFNHKVNYADRLALITQIFFKNVHNHSGEDFERFERLEADYYFENDTIQMIKLREWNDPKVMYYHKENNILIGTTYNVLFRIHDPVLGELTIYGLDLEAVDSLSSQVVMPLFKKILENEQVVKKKWPGRNVREMHVFNWNQKTNKISHLSSSNPSSQDHIEILGALTTNYYNNTLVPGFMGMMTFRFGKKGLTSNAFTFSLNPEYVFYKKAEGGYSAKMNNWIGVGYSYSYTNRKNEKAGFGVILSYLMNRNGDFYDESTFRFQAATTGYNGIRLIPNIYVVGAFKKVYPGFGIQISF